MARYQTLLKALVNRINVGDNRLSSPSLYVSLVNSCNRIANDNRVHLKRDYSSLQPESEQLDNVITVFDALTVAALTRYAERGTSNDTLSSVSGSMPGTHCFPYNSVIQKDAAIFRQLLFTVSFNRRTLPPILARNIAYYVYCSNYFVVAGQNVLPSYTHILTALADDNNLSDPKNELLFRIYNERGDLAVASLLRNEVPMMEPQTLRSVIEASIRALPKSGRFLDDSLQRMVATKASEMPFGESNAEAQVAAKATMASSRFRGRSRNEEVSKRPSRLEDVGPFSRYKVSKETEAVRQSDDRTLTSRMNSPHLIDFLHFSFALLFLISKYLAFCGRSSRAYGEELDTLEDFFLILYPEEPGSNTEGRPKWARQSKELRNNFLGCVDNLALFTNFSTVLKKRILLESLELHLITVFSLSPIREVSQRGTQYLSVYVAHLQPFLCKSDCVMCNTPNSNAADSIVTREVLNEVYFVILSKYAWSFTALSPVYMSFLEKVLPVFPFHKAANPQGRLEYTSLKSHYKALCASHSAVAFSDVSSSLSGGVRFFALVGVQALLRRQISTLVHHLRLSVKHGKRSSTAAQITSDVETVTQLACIITLFMESWALEDKESDVAALDAEAFVCLADIFCGLSRIYLLNEESVKKESVQVVVAHLEHFRRSTQKRVKVYSEREREINYLLRDRQQPFYFWLPQVAQLAVLMRHATDTSAVEAELLCDVLYKAIDVYTEVITHTPHLLPSPEATRSPVGRREGEERSVIDMQSYVREMNRALDSAIVTWNVLSGNDDSATLPDREEKEASLVAKDGTATSPPDSPEARAQFTLRASLMQLLSLLYNNACIEVGKDERESIFLAIPHFFPLLSLVALTSEDIVTALPNLHDVLTTEMEAFQSEMQALALQVGRHGSTAADVTALLHRVALLERTCFSLFRCGVLLSFPAQHRFLPLVTEALQCVVDLAREKGPSRRGKGKVQGEARNITSENKITSAFRQDPKLLHEIMLQANTLYALAAPHFTSSRSYRQLVVQLSNLCFIASLSLTKATTGNAHAQYANVNVTAGERDRGSRHQNSPIPNRHDAATHDMFHMCLAAQQLFRFVGLLLQYPLRSFPSDKYIKVMLPIIVFRATYAKFLFRMSRQQQTTNNNNADGNERLEEGRGGSFRLPNARIFGLSHYIRSVRRLLFDVRSETTEVRTRKLKMYYLYFASFSKIVLKNKLYYERHMKDAAAEVAPFILDAEESVLLIYLCDSMHFFLAKEELFDDTMKELFQVATSELLDALELVAHDGDGGATRLEEYLRRRGITPLSVLANVFRLHRYTANVRDIVRLVDLLNQQVEQTVPLLPPESAQQPISEVTVGNEDDGEGHDGDGGDDDAYSEASKNRQTLSKILQGIREGNRAL